MLLTVVIAIVNSHLENWSLAIKKGGNIETVVEDGLNVIMQKGPDCQYNSPLLLYQKNALYFYSYPDLILL
jgi:hypothetical protein